MTPSACPHAHVGISKLLSALADSYGDEVQDTKDLLASHRFDLAVVDVFSFSALDVFTAQHLPYMAFLHTLLGMFGIEETLSHPNYLLGKRIHQRTFLDRLENSLMTPRMILSTAEGTSKLNAQRIQHGLATYGDPSTNINGHPIIITTIFGFEYAKTLSPLSRLVGHFADTSDSAKSPTTEDDAVVLRWLDSSSKGCVLVAFGTEAVPEKHHLREIIKGVLNSGHRLLLAIRELPLQEIGFREAREIIADRNVSGDDFLSRAWIRQTMVLAHPSVVAFICHGGLQSLVEGLYSGVPLIMLPQWADREANTARVLDRNLGLRLHMDNLTAHQVTDTISLIISRRDDFRMNMQRFVQMNDRAGACTKGAANYIEEVLLFGYDHLIPVADSLGHFAAQSYDVMLFYILLLGFSSYLISLLAARCCGFRLKKSIKTQ